MVKRNLCGIKRDASTTAEADAIGFCSPAIVNPEGRIIVNRVVFNQSELHPPHRLGRPCGNWIGSKCGNGLAQQVPSGYLSKGRAGTGSGGDFKKFATRKALDLHARNCTCAGKGSAFDTIPRDLDSFSRFCSVSGRLQKGQIQ